MNGRDALFSALRAVTERDCCAAGAKAAAEPVKRARAASFIIVENAQTLACEKIAADHVQPDVCPSISGIWSESRVGSFAPTRVSDHGGAVLSGLWLLEPTV